MLRRPDCGSMVPLPALTVIGRITVDRETAGELKSSASKRDRTSGSAQIGIVGDIDRSLIDIKPAGKRVIAGKKKLARTKGRNAAGPADDRRDASARLAGIDRAFSAAEGKRAAAGRGILDGRRRSESRRPGRHRSDGQHMSIGVDRLCFGVHGVDGGGARKRVVIASGAGVIDGGRDVDIGGNRISGEAEPGAHGVGEEITGGVGIVICSDDGRTDDSVRDRGTASR